MCIALLSVATIMDSLVCSRQEIRDKISDFMRNIIHAKPLEESLLIID